MAEEKETEGTEAKVETPKVETAPVESYTKADLDAARKSGRDLGYGDAMTAIDKKFEKLGFKKEAGVKTSDFAEHILSQQKKDVEPDERVKTLQGENEQLRKNLEALQAELEGTKSTMQKTTFAAKVDSEIAPLLSGVDDSMRSTLREMILMKLEQANTDTTNDGKIVFVGDEGQYLASADATGYKSISEFVSENFGAFVTKKQETKTVPNQAELAKMTMKEKQRVGKTIAVDSPESLSKYMVAWSKKNSKNLGSPEYAQERARVKKEFGIEDQTTY